MGTKAKAKAKAEVDVKVEVVVDTYALMAMAFGELTPKAEDVLMAIRNGKAKGIISPMVAYEFALQWYKGRLPSLESVREVEAFLLAYFDTEDLNLEDFVKIASIKYEGDVILSKSDLSNRRLSLVDSSIIYIARKREAPILSGDKDLSYIASKMGIEVIW